jgi:hypothetical protein
MNLHNNEAGRRVSRAVPIIFVIYVIQPNLQYDIRFFIIDGYCILKSKERKRFFKYLVKISDNNYFLQMVTWQPKSN